MEAVSLARALAAQLPQLASAARQLSCAALPQPCDPSGEEEAYDEAHRRRLQEMASHAVGAAQPQPPTTAPGEAQPAPAGSGQRSSSSSSRAHFPTAQQVAGRLRSNRAASCSAPSSPASSGDAAGARLAGSGILDWRDVVAAMRAAQQTVSGEQMLTDTFG